MKQLFLLSLVTSTLFFGGCSTREVYEPELVKAPWEHHGDAQQNIIDTSRDAALLSNRKVRIKDKIVDVTIASSHRILGVSDGWVLSSNIDGNLSIDYIADKTMTQHFELKKTIAGASIKDNVLAVLFADNEMALYTISSKKLLFNMKGLAPTAVDAKIVNPHFMNNMVLFSTLDGKVVIVDVKKQKMLRTTIVSSKEMFNNVIYFNVIDSKFIVATGYKLMSMAKKEIRVDYEIRNIIYDGKYIFLTTKQGEIFALDSDLNIQAKVKFPFAHFLGLIAKDDKLFALEKEGYIIELTKDLEKFTVYNVEFEDGYVFVGETKFFVADEYISTQQ